MAPLFFHDDNNSCLVAGQQVVISSVGGSCSYVLKGGPWGYDAEPMTGWQARHSNWNKSLLRKQIGYTTAGWIGHYRCWDVTQYYDTYDAFIWMGYVGIHTRIQCRSLKPASVNDSYHLTLTKQNALFIKATTTCHPMVCHQHFNLIPFWLHCRMPLDRGQSWMSDWLSALFGRS
jgi:hypothetical protein